MHALLQLSRAIDRLNAFVGKYAIWLIFGATVISAVNAVIRKAFNYSSNGFLEVQWYLFAWSFLIAAGYTLLKREHVRIDVLNSHLPRKVRLAIEILGLTFFLTPLCIMVLYYTVPLTIQMFESGEMSNNPGGLIRWPVKMLLPAGLALLVLQAISELIKRVAFLTGHGPNPLRRKSAGGGTEDLVAAIKAHSGKGRTGQ